jgi:hypothetical protein
MDRQHRVLFRNGILQKRYRHSTKKHHQNAKAQDSRAKTARVPAEQASPKKGHSETTSTVTMPTREA